MNNKGIVQLLILLFSSLQVSCSSNPVESNGDFFKKALLEYEKKSGGDIRIAGNNIDGAVRTGDSDAMLFVSLLHLENNQMTKSWHWLKKSALTGHVGAMYVLCRASADSYAPGNMKEDGALWGVFVSRGTYKDKLFIHN